MGGGQRGVGVGGGQGQGQGMLPKWFNENFQTWDDNDHTWLTFVPLLISFYNPRHLQDHGNLKLRCHTVFFFILNVSHQSVFILVTCLSLCTCTYMRVCAYVRSHVWERERECVCVCVCVWRAFFFFFLLKVNWSAGVKYHARIQFRRNIMA